MHAQRNSAFCAPRDPDTIERWVTIGDAASIIGCSRRRVNELVAEGKLAVRVNGSPGLDTPARVVERLTCERMAEEARVRRFGIVATVPGPPDDDPEPTKARRPTKAAAA